MDIIRKDGSEDITEYTLSGVRLTATARQKEAIFYLALKGAEADDAVQVFVVLFMGQGGDDQDRFEEVRIEMPDCLDPDLIPQDCAITTGLIMDVYPSFDMLLAMIAGPSARLTVELLADEEVELSLTIGSFATNATVALARVSRFLEPEPV